MLSALNPCIHLALAGGAFLGRGFRAQEQPDTDLERRERRYSTATVAPRARDAERLPSSLSSASSRDHRAERRRQRGGV